MNLNIIISIATCALLIVIYLLVIYMLSWFSMNLLDHFCDSYFQKNPFLKKIIVRLVGVMIFIMFCMPIVMEFFK